MIPRTFWSACAAIVLAAGSAVALAEKKPDALTLKLSATVARAESDVLVRTRVEPDERSRELTIEWVADDLSGGLHTIELDGQNAAITHHYSLKRMSPGHYLVTATLRLTGGKEIRRTSQLTVVGMTGDGGFDDLGTDAASAGRTRPATQR
jgi:hypothetical protein